MISVLKVYRKFVLFEIYKYFTHKIEFLVWRLAVVEEFSITLSVVENKKCI